MSKCSHPTCQTSALASRIPACPRPASQGFPARSGRPPSTCPFCADTHPYTLLCGRPLAQPWGQRRRPIRPWVAMAAYSAPSPGCEESGGGGAQLQLQAKAQTPPGKLHRLNRHLAPSCRTRRPGPRAHCRCGVAALMPAWRSTREDSRAISWPNCTAALSRTSRGTGLAGRPQTSPESGGRLEVAGAPWTKTGHRRAVREPRPHSRDCPAPRRTGGFSQSRLPGPLQAEGLMEGLGRSSGLGRTGLKSRPPAADPPETQVLLRG